MKAFKPENYVTKQITKESVLSYKSAFDTIDTDKDGTITPLEIRKFFESIKKDLNKDKELKDQIYEMLKILDDDYSGGVDFEEFFKFMTELYDEKSKQEEFKNLLKKAVKENQEIQKTEEASRANKKQKELRSGQPAKKTATTAKDTKKNKDSEFNPDDYVNINLTRETVIEMKKAFDLLDADSSGIVSPSEIVQAFEKRGIMGNNKIVYQVLGELDEDHSGGINFEEFIKFLSKKVSPKDSMEEIMKAFKFFDTNEDGKINWLELKQVASYLGEEMTDEEIHHMFDKADLDDDGFITKDDFYNIVTGKGYY